MQTKFLASNQSSVGFSVTGDGLVNDPNTVKSGDSGALSGNLHVSIVGTSASVAIFGRAHPVMPFIQLGATITATGVSVIPLLPEMYAQVTAIVSAVVNVAVAYPIAGR